MDLQLGAVFLFIAILGFSVVDPVYADGHNARPDFSYYIDNFIVDIREAVTFDPDRKAQLISNHINALQDRIDEKVENNEPIPKEYEERRLDKITGLENAVLRIELNSADNTKSNALTVLKQKLTDNIQNFKALQDINEIRTCVSDFNALRTMNPESQITKDFATDIDNECNELPSAKELCHGRFNTLDLASANSAYIELSKTCPTLKSIPFEKASTIFYGEQ